jgi:hypothetical protein
MDLRSIPRPAIAVAAVCLVAAVVFALVLVVSTRGTSTVETQGTLNPTTSAAPPRTAGTPVPTTPPATEATTTTSEPVPSSTAPAPTRPPTTRPTPVVPEPEVPAEAPVADPFHLTIDRIGVDARVVAVGVEPGTNAMQIPGLDDVGWYQHGSLPGDATGTAVLVGHVDGNGRPGVFANLRDLTPGDTFTVTLPDGSARSFAVTGLQQFDKQALPSDLFSRGGPPRLALITCGGPFDPATGHYLDNVVVVAAAL